MARWTVPGPCKVSWNGVNLGYTKAGVTIRIDTALLPIIDDEHGTEPADFIRAGKAAMVDVVLNDMAAYKAASAYIGGLLSNMDKATGLIPQIGKLANDRSGTTTNILGKALTITERITTNLWTAPFAMPSDPQQILLASTQENLLPITFVIALNDDDELFSVLPSYMRTP